jgi:hypothetical protein
MAPVEWEESLQISYPCMIYVSCFISVHASAIVDTFCHEHLQPARTPSTGNSRPSANMSAVALREAVRNVLTKKNSH